MVRRGAHGAVAVLLVAAVTGCDATPRRPDRPADTATGSPAATAGPPVPCPTDHRYGTVNNEVVGVPDTFRALLFAAEVRAGVRIKIAFKIPGSGDLTLRADGPDGAVVEVADLIRHSGGSSWQVPGEEWGSTWTFSAPGCWTVRADRTDGTRAALALRAG